MSKSKDAKEKDLCEQDEEFLEALNPLNNNQRHIVLDRLTETQHQTENERDRKWLKEVDKLYQKNKSCKEKIKELNKVCVKLIDEQRELQKENTDLKELNKILICENQFFADKVSELKETLEVLSNKKVNKRQK